MLILWLVWTKTSDRWRFEISNPSMLNDAKNPKTRFDRQPPGSTLQRSSTPYIWILPTPRSGSGCTFVHISDIVIVIALIHMIQTQILTYDTKSWLSVKCCSICSRIIVMDNDRLIEMLTTAVESVAIHTYSVISIIGSSPMLYCILIYINVNVTESNE